MRKIITACSALVFLTAMSTAHAAMTEVCDTALSMTKNYTNAVEITGRQADRDRATLLGKIDDARLKMLLDKPEDAWQKLEDYKTKVASMVESLKPSLSQTDAESLTTAAIESQMVCTGM